MSVEQKDFIVQCSVFSAIDAIINVYIHCCIVTALMMHCQCSGAHQFSLDLYHAKNVPAPGIKCAYSM